MQHVDDYSQFCSQLRYEFLHNEPEGVILRHWNLFGRLLSKHNRQFFENLSKKLRGFRPVDGTSFPAVSSMEAFVAETSASQKLQFALISDVILEPYARTSALAPHFQCWLLHVQYLRILIKREATQTEVEHLQQLADECLRRCVELYGSKFMTSKVHFASHLLHEISLFGMVRFCWTFPYEQYNHALKLRVSNSNRRQVTWALFQRDWILKFAQLFSGQSE